MKVKLTNSKEQDVADQGDDGDPAIRADVHAFVVKVGVQSQQKLKANKEYMHSSITFMYNCILLFKL